MRFRLPEVVDAASSTLELCGIGEGDRVALWTDTARQDPLMEGFFIAAKLLGANPLLLLGMETADTLLASPPDSALDAFKKSDLVVDLATQPWLYTEANAQTLSAGVPILQVLLGAEDFVRLVPRRDIAEEAKEIAASLAGAHEIHITSGQGTDLRIRCGARKFTYQAGFTEPPDHVYDSVGVSAITFYPEREGAEGNVVVDGPVSLYPKCFLPNEPVRFAVKGGRATSVEGGADARRVAAWMAAWEDPNSYVFAHTGFGLEPRASLVELTPVDAESLRGGVNVAFGANIFPQGGGDVRAKSHLDAILLEATFAVDGRVLVKDGETLAAPPEQVA